MGESRRRGYRAEATPAPRSDRWSYTDTDKEHGHIVITPQTTSLAAPDAARRR